MKIETLYERLEKFPGAEIEQIGEREYIAKTNGLELKSRNVYTMWQFIRDNWTETDHKEEFESDHTESEFETELKRNIGRRIKIERPLFGKHISTIDGTIHDVKSGVVHIYSMNGGFRAIDVDEIITHKYMR